jgi:transposase
VIAIPGGAQVLIATKPVDFRKGMDGLAAVVKEHLRADPYSVAILCSAPSAPTGEADPLGWN